MAVAEPEVPAWIQAAVNFGALLAMVSAGALTYLRRVPPPSVEAQIVGGAFADRQAMVGLTIALSESAKKLTNSLDEISSELRRTNEELGRVGRQLREGKE